MKNAGKSVDKGLTRRGFLKTSGAAVGGLALGGAMIGTGAGNAVAYPECDRNGCGYPVSDLTTQTYTYPRTLDLFTPGTPIDSDELRITFLGTAFPPNRRAQQMMSIFVEVGDAQGEADQFVFDCGAGVLANYAAMGISFGRMNKIFISHLHADHMSDLSAIYCFGPANDRKSPLYVWGSGPSGVRSPIRPHRYYDDGTKAFCAHLREAMRWHTESFSFLPSASYDTKLPSRYEWGLPCDPEPVGDDPADDGYALVPIELDWRKYGRRRDDNVAYNNRATGVKITHFPVIHTRMGAMGYKLEWNGLSMIYTSDTRPETRCVQQARNADPMTGVHRGVDVFIHEMILPPELLAMKNMGLTEPITDPDDPLYEKYMAGVYEADTIIHSSHTPQGAFGYLLSRIDPRPKLTCIAHFPATDDTVECALRSVKSHVPDIEKGRDIIWASDLLVLRVKKDALTGETEIEQLMGDVSDYTYAPAGEMPSNLKTPTYHRGDGQMDPTAQLDTQTLIKAGPNTYCENGY